MSFGHLISKGLPSVNMGSVFGFQGFQVKLEFRLFSLQVLVSLPRRISDFFGGILWSSDSNSGNGSRNNSSVAYRAAHVNITLELQQWVPTLLCRPSLECLRLRQELLCALDATVFIYFPSHVCKFCELVQCNSYSAHSCILERKDVQGETQ